MTWSDKYVGTPALRHGRDAQGCDCWGLARLVYRNELGIDLPSYAEGYACPDEIDEIDLLIGQARLSGLWEKVATVAPFHMLVFGTARFASHIGVAVDARRMLHIKGNDAAKVEDFTGPRWKPRFKGAFKHGLHHG